MRAATLSIPEHCDKLVYRSNTPILVSFHVVLSKLFLNLLFFLFVYFCMCFSLSFSYFGLLARDLLLSVVNQQSILEKSKTILRALLDLKLCLVVATQS